MSEVPIPVTDQDSYNHAVFQPAPQEQGEIV